MEKIKLTPMESTIVRTMAQGLTASEAASALYISRRTVDFHLANVYDKCKTRSFLKALIALGCVLSVPEDITA